jgi:hypothetical protein
MHLAWRMENALRDIQSPFKHRQAPTVKDTFTIAVQTIIVSSKLASMNLTTGGLCHTIHSCQPSSTATSMLSVQSPLDQSNMSTNVYAKDMTVQPWKSTCAMKFVNSLMADTLLLLSQYGEFCNFTSTNNSLLSQGYRCISLGNIW